MNIHENLFMLDKFCVNVCQCKFARYNFLVYLQLSLNQTNR